MSFFTVESLTQDFSGKAEILSDISFSIAPGEFIILAGANGSGKTILSRHLNALLKPSSGKLTYRGEPYSRKNLNKIRQKAGLVFQDSDAQTVELVVENDIIFGPKNIGLPRKESIERCEEAINALGLKELRKRYIHSLSGGEKKRVALAGVLAMKPELLILDEPFTGLDYPGVKDVLHYILKLNASGLAVLLITHDLEKCLAHTDRILVIKKGQLINDSSPEESLSALEKAAVMIPYGFKEGKRKREEITWK